MTTMNGTTQSGIRLPYALVPPIEEVKDPQSVPSGFTPRRELNPVIAKFFNLITDATWMGAVFITTIVVTFMYSQHVKTVLVGLITYFAGRLALRNSIPGIIAAFMINLIFIGNFVGTLWPLFTLLVFICIAKGVTSRVVFGKDSVVKGSLLPASNSTNVGLATLEESMRSTWGVAGGHIGSNTQFGTAAVAGAKGEKIIGEALKTITDEFPFVRVFHGIRFTPGRDGADIDHVALVGNKVFFIDAKYWSYASYYWDFGVVKRDGESFSGGDVHMDSAMGKWVTLLPHDTTVTSRIALSKNEGRNYSYQVNNYGAPAGVSLTTTRELISELRQTAISTPPMVNRRLVRLFSNELQR